MSPHPGNPRSATQMTQEALDWFDRLESHLANLRAGRAWAVKDVAVALRALLGTTNKSNDFLARFCKTKGVHVPSVTAKPELKSKGRDIILGAGALPYDEGVTRPIDVWRDEVCLISRHTLRDRYTWQRFLTEYAGSSGAHTGRTVPDILGRTEAFGVAGLDLGTYMLTVAGQATLEALDEALVAVGDKSLLTAYRPRLETEAEISEVVVYTENSPGMNSLLAAAQFRCNKLPAVIFRVTDLPGVGSLTMLMSARGKTVLTTDWMSVFEPG